MQHPHRTVLVPFERIEGWARRFGDRHGRVSTERSGTRVTLSAADGAVAEYDEVAPPERFGLVLVRRGGYAVGVVDRGEVTASKCGTRYVQGKTKAGGWSQQRFARRRANQAGQLASAAAEAIDRVLATNGELSVYGGGDRDLVAHAVRASRTRPPLAERWLDVREPRRATLDTAAEQARSIPIALNDLA